MTPDTRKEAHAKLEEADALIIPMIEAHIVEQITTRAKLALLVPPDGMMIELGVARGQFAVALMQANPSAQYVGIDRWSDHHDGEEYAAANALIEIMGGSVIRSAFADALPMIEDHSADLIYIDGYAHTGQEGGETLRDWWPKLKPGGIFAGHDYDVDAYPQTVDAVNQFVLDYGLPDELRIIEEKPHPSWWLRKPISSNSGAGGRHPSRERLLRLLFGPEYRGESIDTIRKLAALEYNEQGSDVASE